jgi:hypothetical protein
MKRCVAVMAVLLSVLAAVRSAEARGPYGSISVGNWKGGAFTSDQTGEFSHCGATAVYQSGIIFVVMIDGAPSWSLGFAHDSWSLSGGQPFPIALTFDGGPAVNVQGIALSSKLVRVPMPDNSSLINQFRKARSMTAYAQGQLFQFNLDQTAQLLPTLINCVAKVKQYGIAKAGDFSVPAVPKQAAASPAGGSLKPGPQTGPADMQIEAVELASNFILKTSLRNPHVLSRSETPSAIAASGAAWRSDEAAGFVRIIPPREGMKGIDVTAAVVAGDAKDCGGKFASGRMSELVDSDVVFRGFSSCEDSAGARISQYFLVSRKKGGFVLFSVVSNMKTEEARTVARDERLADFRKAAWVVVNPADSAKP